MKKATLFTGSHQGKYYHCPTKNLLESLKLGTKNLYIKLQYSSVYFLLDALRPVPPSPPGNGSRSCRLFTKVCSMSISPSIFTEHSHYCRKHHILTEKTPL